MSILEIIAFITSLFAVILGVLGPRITWPFWSAGSLLYAYIFFQSAYYASAALQFIFIIGGIWGWLGWGPKGAKPKKLETKARVSLVGAILLSAIMLLPILTSIGATSSVKLFCGFFVVPIQIKPLSFVLFTSNPISLPKHQPFTAEMCFKMCCDICK